MHAADLVPNLQPRWNVAAFDHLSDHRILTIEFGPRIQHDVQLAVGLSRMQILRCILLPQALRVTLLAFANYVTQLVKDTSIASAIAVPEIMFLARNLVTSTFQTSLIYLAVMCIYAAMILPIGVGFIRLERHFGSAR